MRRLLVPVALVAASLFLFPSGDGLLARWRSLPSLEPKSASASANLALDSLRRQWGVEVGQDTSARTEVLADPFRVAAGSDASRSRSRQAPASGPPPPRLWKVTGRVGERAAVLSHPDGRVQVVSVGQSLDSAAVVGIGPGGVELEDRGGRFTLRIP